MVTFRSESTPESKKLNFCSLPCSPTGELTTVPFPWHPESKLRTRVGDADYSEEFDFEFPVHQYNQQKQSVDVMLPTDEVPPLKLPPCLQENSKAKCLKRTLPQSGSSSRVPKRSFSCLSSGDKELDNDPFMAALVQVRDEGMCDKRSQSLLSMKTSSRCSSFNSHQVAPQIEVASTVSVKIKKVLLGCGNQDSRLWSYTAALRKFLETWKSRFKVRGEKKGV